MIDPVALQRVLGVLTPWLDRREWEAIRPRAGACHARAGQPFSSGQRPCSRGTVGWEPGEYLQVESLARAYSRQRKDAPRLMAQPVSNDQRRSVNRFAGLAPRVF